MNIHTDKIQENKSKAGANAFSQKSNGESTFQFVDNRPEAIVRRKFQEINDQSRVSPTIANNSQRSIGNVDQQVTQLVKKRGNQEWSRDDLFTILEKIKKGAKIDLTEREDLEIITELEGLKKIYDEGRLIEKIRGAIISKKGVNNDRLPELKSLGETYVLEIMSKNVDKEYDNISWWTNFERFILGLGAALGIFFTAFLPYMTPTIRTSYVAIPTGVLLFGSILTALSRFKHNSAVERAKQQQIVQKGAIKYKNYYPVVVAVLGILNLGLNAFVGTEWALVWAKGVNIAMTIIGTLAGLAALFIGVYFDGKEKKKEELERNNAQGKR